MVEQGLAVSMAPSLLAESFRGVALRPIDGPAPSRDVFALLPPGGQHPLAEDVLRALAETAQEQRRPDSGDAALPSTGLEIPAPAAVRLISTVSALAGRRRGDRPP